MPNLSCIPVGIFGLNYEILSLPKLDWSYEGQMWPKARVQELQIQFQQE